MKIHRILDTVADRYPEKPAINDPGGSISYDDLRARSRIFSGLLKEHGLKRRRIAVIYMEPSINYVLALLSVLRSDAVFIPLSPNLPGKRVQGILEKVVPEIIITTKALGAQAARHYNKCEIFQVPENSDHVEDGFEFLPPAAGGLSRESTRIPDEEACYLITTSGSTGLPKIIIGSQKGLIHFVRWEIDEFRLDESFRVSMLSPVTFDVSLRDIFVPLCIGGTLFIPDEETRVNPARLSGWLQENSISLMHVVPTVLRLLVQEIRLSTGKRSLPSLKYVLIAGETLFGNDVINWRECLGNRTELVNLYGPSETTLAKFFYRIPEEMPSPEEVIPLGKPIPDTCVWLKMDGRPCGTGRTGEIFISTPFMSKGYFKDPDLNRSSFPEDMLWTGEEKIAFKTGDLGFLREDGNLCFSGRVDGQIKLYGNRIEPGEIEVALLRHPAIKQAAVSAKKINDHDVRLIGYVVPIPDGEIISEDLKRFLKNYLPEYMIPSLFMVLDSLPLTQNNKIDRKALPEPSISRPALKEEYIEPSTALEKRIMKIWREVLKIDRVGLNDNFFELGGNSVLSAIVVGEVKHQIKAKISLVEFFQNPTVRLLAKACSKEEGHSSVIHGSIDRSRKRREYLARQKNLRKGIKD